MRITARPNYFCVANPIPLFFSTLPPESKFRAYNPTPTPPNLRSPRDNCIRTFMLHQGQLYHRRHHRCWVSISGAACGQGFSDVPAVCTLHMLLSAELAQDRIREEVVVHPRHCRIEVVAANGPLLLAVHVVGSVGVVRRPRITVVNGKV